MNKVKIDPINGLNGNGSGRPKGNASPEKMAGVFPAESNEAFGGRSRSATRPDKNHPTLRGIIAEFHLTTYEYGFNLAITSRTLEPRQEHLDAIKQLAVTAARECKRESFDFTALAHDQMHKEEHDKHRHDRRFAEDARKFAYAEMRERAKEAKQAKTLKHSNKTLWFVLGAAAAIGLATTFVITFHDVFFLMPDEMLAWLISSVSALIIGAVIAVMILFDTDADGERSATNWIGLLAGVLIAVGFGIARLRDAGSSGEYLMSLALMLIELGLVVGLEGVAIGIRSANRRNAANTLIETRSQALFEEAAEHYEHCRQEVLELNDTVVNDIGYVEERIERSLRIGELEEAMVASGNAGYYDGISQNSGITLKGGF